ncbi:hypothetical protein CBR_g55394 [Chara braunii]|uniref:Nuclear pore complex protein Nup85 n=1 Tax=Chara braunii TaxID=69332 RepID=A0A388K7P0_CHABU|nr:hypothetical protein CBR_g55394 [Chara braunii]|eukprot:GBG66051.1 hypothetical protein CBR_g55394 [Chara braunii]
MSTASTIKMDMPSSYSEIPELSVRVHQGRKRLDFAWGTGSYLYLADIHRAPISQSPGTADVAVGSGDLSQASGSASGAAGGEGGGGGGKGGGVYKLTWTPLDARDRRLAYETFPHYSNLQYKKRETAVEGTDEDVPIEWWESVLQYSRNICAVLESQSKENEGAVAFRMDEGGKSQRLVGDLLRKAVWELVEVFYVTKSSNSMVGERLAEWLKNSIDILVPGEVSAQAKLEAIQTSLKEEWQRLPEDNPEYWTSIASAVAVGWLPEALCGPSSPCGPSSGGNVVWGLHAPEPSS